MSSIDPLQRAADCGRAIDKTADPEQRKMLLNLQKLWIALSNEAKTMSDAERAEMVDRIGRLHAELANSGWRGLRQGHKRQAYSPRKDGSYGWVVSLGALDCPGSRGTAYARSIFS